MCWGELETAGKPVIEVLNKVDLLPAGERERLLRVNCMRGAVSNVSGRLPVEIAISARSGEGIADLIAMIEEKTGGADAEDPTMTAEFRIPQREGRVLAALEAGAFVERKRFEGNLVCMAAWGPASLLGRYRRFQVADVSAPETSSVPRPRLRVRRG